MARTRTRDGRPAYDLFPRHSRLQMGRWLYAVGFADGRTKIGITGAPRARMQQLIRSEGPAQWMHLGRCLEYRSGFAAERLACAHAALLAERRVGLEVFRGLCRQQALACLRLGAAGV